MTGTFIFDIDGTLADCTHRLHHIQGGKKDWKSFLSPALVAADSPTMVISLAYRLATHWDTQIILVSGRPEELRATTVNWLAQFSVPVSRARLEMRPTGDYRPDVEIKREILNKLRAEGVNIIGVFDDRPRLVDMWREEGLTCYALPWHGEEPQPIGPVVLGILTLAVGPSGSGKSTWLLEQYPQRCPYVPTILSSDMLRARLLGDETDQTKNALVFAKLHEIAKAHLNAGLDVVIDATHLRRKDRLDAVALAKGGPVIYLVFPTIKGPPWHGNLEVQRKHVHTFKSQEADIRAGDGLPNVIVEVIDE